MSYVYAIVDKTINKVIYVGSTKRNIKTRFKEHIRDIKNNKHNIKKLNTYKDNTEDLEVRELICLNTDNSLILSFTEQLFNSIYKPFNKCVIKGAYGTVTLARCDMKLANKLIETIRMYCGVMR